MRESEARYQAISELTSTYAYLTHLEPDGSLTLEWVTGDFVQITGYTLEEIKQLGGPIRLIHPSDQPVAVQRTERLLAGQPSVAEFRIVTKAGETRWLRDYGRPIRDEVRNRTVRIYGAAQDITDRKQAELALRQSEERFRVAFEEGPLGMATFAADGTLREANRALGQMLGYAPDELAGKLGPRHRPSRRRRRPAWRCWRGPARARSRATATRSAAGPRTAATCGRASRPPCCAITTAT